MSIDWLALWHLGGHGIYVWPGYAAAALYLAWEVPRLLRALRGEEDAP
jgi:heme exporter protein CcmD